MRLLVAWTFVPDKAKVASRVAFDLVSEVCVAFVLALLSTILLLLGCALDILDA